MEQPVPSETLSLTIESPIIVVTDEKSSLSEQLTGNQPAGAIPVSGDDAANANAGTAAAFGHAELPIQEVVAADGSHSAVVDFTGKILNLNELIDKLPPQIGSLFVFEQAKIILEQEAHRLTFTGTLRMDGPVLGAFKSFLKLDTSPVLMASIDATGQDLSTKIRPANIVFKCVVPAYQELAPNVVLSSTVFQLQLKKVLDDNTGTESWNVIPLVGAALTFNSLAATPVVMAATVTYASGALQVLAAVDQANSLFGINKLDLTGLKASFQTGNEANIQLAGAFQTSSRSFDFAGALTPTFIGLTASAASFTSSDLSSLFSAISGTSLSMPAFPVNFENVSIGIASAAGDVNGMHLERGVQLGCHITVHDQACEAKALISTDFVVFEGDLTNVHVGDTVTIQQAALRMQYAAVSSTKATEFAVLGKLSFKNIDLSAKLAYEKIGSDWSAIVYAGMASDTFRLSTVFPEMTNTFPDTLRFSKVAVIYATQAGAAQDPDFGFTVKQGLQLTGTLQEVPALSSLLKNKSMGMQLTALLSGTTTSISIAMPESSRLNLGARVVCDPFSAAVQITPEPELDLVMGLAYHVPKQDDPLHFDLKLGVNAVGASGSGTMKGYWKNPFGVVGLQIGPALGLEVDIVYATFFSTGTPSGFGIAGGIMLGDVAGTMALKMNEDPTQEILYGEVDNLSPANLVKFASGLSKLNITADAVPDFFDLKQLKLYCAPMGGSIGTISYPQGFSFAFDLVLFGKETAMFANVNDSGVSANGHMDAFTVGPLTVTGAQGPNAAIGLELSTSKQAVLVDGAMDFVGARTGVLVDVSKQGVHFKLEQNFAQLLKYSVDGYSTGPLASPATMDFDLKAIFDSSITSYLRTTVTGRINDTLNQTNKSIGDLQADLDRKQKAYEADYNVALDKLNKARSDAAAYLQQCQQKVTNAQRDMDQKVGDAQKGVDNAQVNLQRAMDKAQNDLTQANNAAAAAIAQAQQKVDRTRSDYQNAFASANDALTRAQQSYDSKVGSANNALNDARNKVNGLQGDVDQAQRDYDHSTIKRAYYGPKLLAIKAAKATADGGLSLAQDAVNKLANCTEAITFNAAMQTMQGVQTTTKSLWDAAARSLTVAQSAGKASIDAASKTLTGVQSGAEATALVGAKNSLDLARKTGEASLAAAKGPVLNVASSAAYLAVTAASNTLDAVQHGTSFAAFSTAKSTLEGAKLGADGVLKLSSYIAAHSGDFIDVKHAELSAKLSAIKRGELFKAKVDVVVLGAPYSWALDFDAKNVPALVDNLFQKAFDQAKKNAGV